MKKIILTISILLFVSGCSFFDLGHTIELSKNTVSYGVDMSACSLIKAIDGTEITEEDVISDGKLTTSSVIVDCPSIDTATLGKQTITYKIADKSYDFEIEVVDDVAPTLTVDDRYVLNVGEDFNIADEYEVSDNYDKEDDITVKIDGDYDIDKVGEYKITLTASDTSENSVAEEITLVVEDEDDQTNEGSSNSNSQSGSNSNSSDKSFSYQSDDGDISIKTDLPYKIQIDSDSGTNTIIITQN